MTKKAAKKGRIPMLPREQMTKKARAAIQCYAEHYLDRSKMYTPYHLAEYVLTAERMRRKSLYEYLQEKGYRWLPKFGVWIRTTKENDHA